jgi:tetratricopeptide (TPR) repeat protein
LTPLPAEEFSRLFVEKFRTRALEFEQKKEWLQALQSWEIVQGFTPQDEEIRKKMEALRHQIATLSEQHFSKGVAFFQKHSLVQARKEFLSALYYNPEHIGALEYLKIKIPGEEYTIYEVKKGDTLKEIARKKYGDPQKDFLIAYFNDLKLNTRPVPRTMLRLPILEPLKVKEKMDTEEEEYEPPERPQSGQEEWLAAAQGHLAARRYKECITAAEKVLSADPANKEAKGLITQAGYWQGKGLLQAKKYGEALTAFNRVDLGYRDVKESILFAKKQLSEAHYLQGVKHYTDQELEKAIKEWEMALIYDPGHSKAKRDMESARSLLQKLKEVR